MEEAANLYRAVFRHIVEEKGLTDKFYIDSFGTGAYHLGSSPDRRSASECKKHGIKVSHKAQKIQKQHLQQFDYIMAMDDMNYEDLIHLARGDQHLQSKVHLFGEYRTDSKTFPKIIDDPYYGGNSGFEFNFKQLTHFSHVFLDQLDI